MLLCFLNLTIPFWHELKLQLPAVPLGCHPSQDARYSKSSILQSSDEREQSPCSQYFVGSSFASELLAICYFLLSILQSICLFCFWENLIQASGHIQSRLVVFWISESLPCTHLYPSGSRVRKMWNLVVPVHSSERWTPFASKCH